MEDSTTVIDILDISAQSSSLEGRLKRGSENAKCYYCCEGRVGEQNLNI